MFIVVFVNIFVLFKFISILANVDNLVTSFIIGVGEIKLWYFGNHLYFLSEN